MAMEMRWHGPKVKAAEREAASRGIALAMEHLLGKSLEVVPREDGDLANSARAQVDGLTGAVSFDTPYAVRQHEELTWQHDNGQTAKYLERPATQEHQAMLAIVAEQIKRGLS